MQLGFEKHKSVHLSEIGLSNSTVKVNI